MKNSRNTEQFPEFCSGLLKSKSKGVDRKKKITIFRPWFIVYTIMALNTILIKLIKKKQNSMIGLVRLVVGRLQCD